jgi:hypothetical protein
VAGALHLQRRLHQRPAGGDLAIWMTGLVMLRLRCLFLLCV